MIYWPTSLRDYFLISWRELPPQNVVRSPMDAGPAKVRRRSTADVRTFELRMFLKPSLLTVLDDFFVTTTKSGTLSFEMKNPRTKSDQNFRFVDRPTYVQHKRGYIVNLTLEELPS